MRVGFFTESYYPIVNGVSTSVKTLAMELVAAGHTPVVIAPRYPGTALIAPRRPAFRDDQSDGIEVIRLAAWRSPFNPDNPFAFPPTGPVPPGLRHLRLDIIHTQQPFGMGMHGKALAQRLGVPLISTFHTLYTEYTHYFRLASPGVSRRVLAGILRGHYAACAAVVVPSREAGQRLEQIGVPQNRLHVIPTGVPAAIPVLPAEIAATRARFSLPEGAPVLLFVGRVAQEKNLDLLIDAYSRLDRAALAATSGSASANGPHPILLMVGSGPYLESCRRRVRAVGLEATVRFAGYLNRAELAPVYRLSTLFCFPSLTETQGVVLSEAQSYGLPCIVANGGGTPEFVRPGLDALLVPANADAFAEAITTLLRDDVRRESFAAAAYESPLHPTPAQMAERVMAMYEDAMANPGADYAFKYRSNQA